MKLYPDTTCSVQQQLLKKIDCLDSSVLTHGYGEGWALYVERFMDEIGTFEDPALELGFLSSQALRAARIVVDIGLHLGLDDFDGKPWNSESASTFLVEHILIDPAKAKSEIERYLLVKLFPIK